MGDTNHNCDGVRPDRERENKSEIEEETEREKVSELVSDIACGKYSDFAWRK